MLKERHESYMGKLEVSMQSSRLNLVRPPFIVALLPSILFSFSPHAFRFPSSTPI